MDRSLKKLRQTALTCLLGLIYKPDCITSSSPYRMIMNILSVLCRGLNYQALIFISYSVELKTASNSELSLPVTAGVERKQLKLDPCFQYNLACFNTRLSGRLEGGSSLSQRAVEQGSAQTQSQVYWY